MDVLYVAAIKSLLLLAVVQKSLAGKIFFGVKGCIEYSSETITRIQGRKFLALCVSMMHNYRDCSTVISKFQLLYMSLGSENQNNCR